MSKYTMDDLLKMLEEENIFLDDVDFATLDPDKHFGEQGIDSIDLVSILFGVERYFNFPISRGAIAEEWNTINKILNKLNNR